METHFHQRNHKITKNYLLKVWFEFHNVDLPLVPLFCHTSGLFLRNGLPHWGDPIFIILRISCFLFFLSQNVSKTSTSWFLLSWYQVFVFLVQEFTFSQPVSLKPLPPSSSTPSHFLQLYLLIHVGNMTRKTFEFHHVLAASNSWSLSSCFFSTKEIFHLHLHCEP